MYAATLPAFVLVMCASVLVTTSLATTVPFQDVSSMLYYDDALFVGHASGLTRIDPATGSVEASRVVGDIDNCNKYYVLYTNSGFTYHRGAGFFTQERCTTTNCGSDVKCEANFEASGCIPMYFTSTCSGERYYFIQPFGSDVVACSAIDQCNILSATDLTSTRQDPATTSSDTPQGWHCGDPVGFFTVFNGGASTESSKYCPVWRYSTDDNPDVYTGGNTFTHYHTAVGVAIADETYTDGSTPGALYLASTFESNRDGNLEMPPNHGATATVALSRRNTVDFKPACEGGSGCDDGTEAPSFFVQPATTLVEQHVDGRMHKHLSMVYNEDHIYYFYTGCTTTACTSSSTHVMRFCKSTYDPGLDSSTAHVRYNMRVQDPITCNGENLLGLVQAQPGEYLATDTTYASSGSYLFAYTSSAVCVYTYGTGTGSSQVDAVVNLGERLDAVLGAGQADVSCAAKQSFFPTVGVAATISGTNAFAQITGYGTLTSMAVDSVHGHTIAFLTTSDSKVLRLTMSAFQAISNGIYGVSTLDVLESLANPATLSTFVTSTNQLAVATTEGVSTVNAYNCTQHSSCSACATAGDAYCGWCSLTNECTARQFCPQTQSIDRTSTVASEYWHQGASVTCPVVTMISETLVPLDTDVEVTVTVTNIPTPEDGSGYYCLLEDVGTYSATLSGSQLTCTINAAGVPDDLSRAQVPLAVAYGTLADQTALALQSSTSTDMLVYNCDALSADGCSACAAPCKWCVYDNQCQSSETLCRGGTSAEWLTSAQCPAIESTNKTVFSANVDPAPLLVFGNAFPAPVEPSDTYTCHFDFDSGSSDTATATFVNSTAIMCTPPTVPDSAIPTDPGTENVTLAISLGGGPLYTASYRLQYYWCNFISGGSEPDCGRCLSADSAFECGWCVGTGINQDCTLDQHCALDKEWLPNEDGAISSCPSPTLLSVSPQVIPKAGGTSLTIVGRNLGRSTGDITSVSVAGQSCSVDQFTVATGVILCTTPSFPSTVASGSVAVSLSSGAVARLNSVVSVSVPHVSAINPPRGLLRGGTVVTVSGADLKGGNTVTVTLAGVACVIGATHTNTGLVCTLQSSVLRRRATLADVCVQSDGMVAADVCSTSDVGYSIVTDPSLDRVAPENAAETADYDVRVVGERFDALSGVRLAVADSSNATLLSSAACEASSATTLVCGFDQPAALAINTTGYATHYTIFADAWNGDIVGHTIYPDPELTAVDPPEATTGSLVVITGSRLTQFGNFTIEIGGVQAKIVGNPVGDQVTVEVPDLTNEQVGDLSVTYNLQNQNFTTTLSTTLAVASKTSVAPIAGGIAGVALAVVLVLFIVYRVKLSKRQEKEKALLGQMAELESSVIDVAKQGFAELQQGASLAVSVQELKTRPFAEYAMRVFFTSPQTHKPPLERPVVGTREFVEQFSVLLQQDTFVLQFVGALEKQGRTFSIKDRCQVASLLMVVWQRQGVHSYTMLKKLLATNMEQAIKKGSPKLMLRRTETVAEKMLTTWLTIALQQYVHDRVAKPLFNLFQALRLQTQKGPVDAITGAAMYTLNADTLLRERVSYRELTVSAVVELTGATITVTVLSCDSIGQVKRKIFQAVSDTPEAPLPQAWQDAHLYRGEVVAGKELCDVDDATAIDGSWAKLNTLDFYKVETNEQLHVVTHQTHLGVVDTQKKGKRKQSRSKLDPARLQRYHLVRDTTDSAEAQSKIPSEIFLTYLMTVKATLQPFVDELIRAIFDADAMPLPVHCLFHLLETSAAELDMDLQVLHVWKNNSLPLRFWINLVKNPEFLFDVDKTTTINSCLSAVAQVIMDSCSVSDQHLGANSPANKHLYRKEVAVFKQTVSNYYSSTALKAVPHEEGLDALFSSKERETVCSGDAAVLDLMQYALTHRLAIIDVFSSNGFETMANDLGRLLAGYQTELESKQTDGYLQIAADRTSLMIDEDLFQQEQSEPTEQESMPLTQESEFGFDDSQQPTEE
eukprot:m.250412 g.250412  ORF g.250412 m.250412 type:complete len:1981 (-) comp15434_c0_seq1:317-6259(-)